MDHRKSAEAFASIEEHIPGGVNTSLRRIEPKLVFNYAKGSRIRDLDGNEYIDYHLAFGPLILGHRDPDVEKAVDEVRGTMDLVGVGTTELEGKLCDKIVEHVPSAEKVQLANAGSEATFTAIRLSRALTRRKRIIKFQGCYHGWHDYVSMNVTSAQDKVGKYDPISAGMLEEAARFTSVLRYNSDSEVEACVRENRGEVACIIIEPIAHNMGTVPAKTEFLKFLRETCDREDVVLIFDEVLTGFRHALGGYQSICKVTPDLTTFAKAVANGYPMAGLCGPSEMMDRFATAGGDVFFAGTYNAHPYSCAAGLATIKKLESGTIFERLFRLGKMISEGTDEAGRDTGLETFTSNFGSVFTTYFTHPPILDYNDVLRSDPESFVRFRRELIEEGSFLLPVNAKRAFLSAAHTEQDVKETIEKSRQVFSRLRIAPQVKRA